MSRAERNAVSPLVMGAATTPRMASTPPTSPSHPLLMSNTTTDASLSPIPFSWKKYVATVAHTRATTPSVIMAP